MGKLIQQVHPQLGKLVQQIPLQLKRLLVQLCIIILLLLNVCNPAYAFSHDYGGDDIASINLNFKDKEYLIKYTSSNSLCRSFVRYEGKWKSEEMYTSTADDCLMRIAESFSIGSDAKDQEAIKELFFVIITKIFVFICLSWIFRLMFSAFTK